MGDEQDTRSPSNDSLLSECFINQFAFIPGTANHATRCAELKPQHTEESLISILRKGWRPAAGSRRGTCCPDAINPQMVCGPGQPRTRVWPECQATSKLTIGTRYSGLRVSFMTLTGKA